MRANRLTVEQDRIQHMNLNECRQLLQRCLVRDASLIFDLLPSSERNPAAAPPPVAGQPPWCVCEACREMPTDLERKCCGQPPEYCISNLPHMDLYIIDEGVLRLSRRIWNDVRATQDLPDPGESLKQFRYAAYLPVKGIFLKVHFYKFVIIKHHSLRPEKTKHKHTVVSLLKRFLEPCQTSREW